MFDEDDEYYEDEFGCDDPDCDMCYPQYDYYEPYCCGDPYCTICHPYGLQ